MQVGTVLEAFNDALKQILCVNMSTSTPAHAYVIQII
ncbi:uncharacterized protein J3R85_010919 [Psidium guajava]|nr:uncharacterized protein J3R85_010919 [Psidium guajava]